MKAVDGVEPCRAKFDFPEPDPRPVLGPCPSGMRPCEQLFDNAEPFAGFPSTPQEATP